MPKLTKIQALNRTKDMLMRLWALQKSPLSETSLRDHPDGLGKNDLALRALKKPIENRDFIDVAAKVAGDDLADAETKTVSDLRDVIWNGIPKANREE